MRLTRISLVAVVTILFASGCSATRSAFSTFRDRDSETSHDSGSEHEYDPGIHQGGSESEFREPREPVPAPPAMGVSRIKSVSLLKDLSARLHGRKEDCTPDCGNESELVGRCSPIEPCVPTEESRERVNRYQDRFYSGNDTDRLNPLRSLKKSLSGVLHKDRPARCVEDDCTPSIIEPGCSAPQKACDSSARVIRSYKDSCGSSCSSAPPSNALPKRKANLAEPMEDDSQSLAPGMITPDGRDLSPMRLENVPLLPAPQSLDGPSTAPPSIPNQPVPSPVPRVEDLPLPPGTTGVVEPPVWPKLENGNKYQVSFSGPAPINPGPKQPAGPMMIQPRGK